MIDKNDKLKELYKEVVNIIKYIPIYYDKKYDELHKCSEICRLTNAIADLSNGATARALDDTIKEIAYASTEPNFEIRNKYLREAIKDLASGMDKTDAILKYDDMLYRYNGGRYNYD